MKIVIYSHVILVSIFGWIGFADSQRLQSMRLDPVARLHGSLPSSSRHVGFQRSTSSGLPNARFRQRFGMPSRGMFRIQPRRTQSMRFVDSQRALPGGRLSRDQSSGAIRASRRTSQQRDLPHIMLPSQRRRLQEQRSGGNRENHIFARNLKIVDTGSSNIFNIRNPNAQNVTRAQRNQLSNSDRLGVISVDDIIALADAIARMRQEASGTKTNTTTFSSPSSSEKKAGHNADKSKHGAKQKSNTSGQSTPPTDVTRGPVPMSSSHLDQLGGGHMLIVADMHGMAGSNLIIAEPGTSVAVEPHLPAGAIPLGPPGVNPGGNANPGMGGSTSGAATNILDLLGPVAFMSTNDAEWKLLIRSLLNQPIFVDELQRTATSNGVTMDAHGINLIRLGLMDSGPQEMNNLFERTYKNILEETVDNLKKKMFRQFERQFTTGSTAGGPMGGQAQVVAAPPHFPIGTRLVVSRA